MINNRIFEALAVGSIVVTERYPYLESHELGTYIRFAGSQLEVEEILRRTREDREFQKWARVGQRLGSNHSYGARAAAFLRLYRQALQHR